MSLFSAFYKQIPEPDLFSCNRTITKANWRFSDGVTKGDLFEGLQAAWLLLWLGMSIRFFWYWILMLNGSVLWLLIHYMIVHRWIWSSHWARKIQLFHPKLLSLREQKVFFWILLVFHLQFLFLGAFHLAVVDIRSEQNCNNVIIPSALVNLISCNSRVVSVL